MRLVSDSSEQDVRRQDAELSFRWAMRDLTANLMRIARGAGAPERLPAQVERANQAYATYREAFSGLNPDPFTVQQTLDIDPPTSRQLTDRQGTREILISGALQVAASRLVEQRTQEAQGREEMSRGIQRIRHEVEETLKPARRTKRANPLDRLLKDKDGDRWE